MTFWKRAELFTPALCRILARHPRGLPLTDDEVAIRGRMLAYEVAKIASSPTWSTVSVGDMRRFLAGCGLDFCDYSAMKRATVYLRHARKGEVRLSTYLRKAPHFNRELAHLIPLVSEAIKRHGNTTTTQKNSHPPAQTLQAT